MTSELSKCSSTKTLLSNDSVYARIGTVDSGENRIGKSFKMAEGDDRREVNR